MLCSFCQVNVRSGGCQSQSQANRCPNNRGRETDDWDDRITQIAPVSFLEKEMGDMKISSEPLWNGSIF